MAQKQITNYTYLPQNSPGNFKFLDSLNGKILFYALDKEGGAIWSTDGTVEHTKKLPLDNFKLPDSEIGQVIEAYSYIYFIFNYTNTLYRTDGHIVEVVDDFSIAVRPFSSGIIYTKHEELNAFPAIYRIDKEGVTTKIADAGKIIYSNDSLLYYQKTSGENNLLLKYSITSEKEIKEYLGYLEIIDFKDFEGYDDVIYRFQNNYYLDRVFENDSVVSKDLGPLEFNYIPMANWVQKDVHYIKSDAHELQFFKVDSLDKIVGSISRNSIKEILDKIYLPTQCCLQASVISYNVVKDKLIIQVMVGIMVSDSWYLVMYDFEKKEYKISKKINSYPYPIPNPIISEKAENIYQIVDQDTLLYDFNLDTILEIRRNILKEPTNTLNWYNGQIAITDNIYFIVNAQKTPLIQQEKMAIFDSQPISNFIHNDTIQLLHYDYALKEQQYGLNDGEGQMDSVYAGDFSTKFYLGKYPVAIKYINYQKLEVSQFFGSKVVSTIIEQDTYISLENVIRNATHTILSININNGKKIILIDQMGNAKTFIVNGYDEGILQTESGSYLFNFSKGILSKLDLNGLKIVASGIVWQVFIYGEEIFYGKNNNRNNNVAFTSLNYLDKNGQEKILLNAKANNLKIEGDFLVFGLNVYNLKTQHLLAISDRYSLNAFDKNFLINGKLYYAGNGLLEIEKNAYRDLKVAGTVIDVKPFFNGIIIKTYQNNNTNVGTTFLHYYDFSSQKMTEVYEGESFDFNVYNTSSLLLIRNGNQWSVWDATSGGFYDLPLVESESPILSSSNFIVTKDYRYFNKNNGHQFRQFKLENGAIALYKEFYGDNDFLINDKLFLSQFKPARGYELVYFQKDSLFEMPEIVPGPSGVQQPKFFMFKDMLYVDCFTYQHGWQVWKLGELPPYTGKLLNESVLTTTPAFADLVAYPNPFNNRIYLNRNLVAEVQILDLQGKIIQTERLENNNQINIRNLPNGKYLLRLIENGQTRVIPILKH